MRCLPAIALAIWVTLVATGARAQGPTPPCDTPAAPDYAALDLEPNVTVWSTPALGGAWTAPACIGWRDSGFQTLVAAAGRFTRAGGADALLARIGAISAMTGLRYWSPNDNRWLTLIRNAAALSGPDLAGSRADFVAPEMTPGHDLYLTESDNRSTSAVIYRYRLRAASEDRIVLETENVSSVRYLFVTLFSPGELRSVYFFDRDGPLAWRFYSIGRTAAASSGLTAGREESYANRAIAMFNFFAGIDPQ